MAAVFDVDGDYSRHTESVPNQVRLSPAPERQFTVRWMHALFLALAGAMVVILGYSAWLNWIRHRIAPSPDAMVFQVVLHEAWSALSPGYVIAPWDRGGPSIAILDAGGRRGTTSEPFRAEMFRARITIVRYPSGEVLEHVVDPPGGFRDQILAASRAPAMFDFDGDGVADRANCPGGKWCCVRSGFDDRVLWENEDPIEYEWSERLTPLGDLDGDGFAELAVLHPRWDRSTYDIEPLDALFGAKSWLSVVSGARVAPRSD